MSVSLFDIVTGFPRLLESPGKISLKITHFFIGSNGKQAAIVYHPVYVDCCLFKYSIQQFKFLSACFTHL